MGTANQPTSRASIGTLYDRLIEMRAIRLQLGQIAQSARVNSEQKRAVLDLRRRCAESMTKISIASENDRALRADPVLAAEFRSRFADISAKIAIFQAKWPAVLLSTDDPSFAQSAADMRAANIEFYEWAIRIALRDRGNLL
jgi:hypothetical protein